MGTIDLQGVGIGEHIAVIVEQREDIVLEGRGRRHCTARQVVKRAAARNISSGIGVAYIEICTGLVVEDGASIDSEVTSRTKTGKIDGARVVPGRAG